MKEISGRPNILKRLNSDLIKNALKDLGSATKAELAKETGISLTTVGLILSTLVAEGAVLNQGYDESSGGRRAERYTINVNHSLVAALCVEEKYIIYAVGNATGDIFEESRIEIEEPKYTEVVEVLIDSLIERFNSIKCIGIGVPSAVDNGRLFTGMKLKEWHSFNIKAHLEDKYNLPIIVENDLNAIATGFAHNRLKEAEITTSYALNMVYINFTTTGIGAGIITNGMLVRGFSHYAGEVAFLQLGNGKSLYEVAWGEHTDEEYADTIATAIANINCIINPEYVVIGGEGFEFNNLELIESYCSRYIPENIRPEIIHVEDPLKDYIAGVMYITIEEMNSGIKLVTTKRV
jgi:Transcriptional regulator/sugar kinase